MNVGIAFQLVDDLLDFTSTESALGKPVGNDLKEGKLTLPLIYLMERGGLEHRELIRAALSDNGCGTEAKDLILQLLKEHRTMERVLNKAQDFAYQAKGHLSGFPDCPARTALMSIPDYIIERDR